jgi:hypothetical protein
MTTIPPQGSCEKIIYKYIYITQGFDKHKVTNLAIERLYTPLYMDRNSNSRSDRDTEK